MQASRTLFRVILSGALLSTLTVPALSQMTDKSSAAGPSVGDDVSRLKQQIAVQQQQIEQLHMMMEEMKQRLDVAFSSPKAASADPSNQNQVASMTPVAGMIPPVPTAATPSLPAQAMNPEKKTEESPLQFKIGSASITPVGFMDFTGVYRSHTGGSGIGTNFASIPYGNTFQDNLSEFRLSMQNSRVGFRVDAMVKGAHVIGYMESDFLGNNPGNVAVSSNSNTMRSRLYWVDVQKDKWEIMGGQTWSLLTPGRKGISPLPGNLFYTQNIDVNYQVGLFWGRIPEFRFVYHASDKVAFAVAIDSPEQYVGGSAGGGAVTFPAALTSTYPGGELNNGGTTLNVPNVAPDVILKFAVDPNSKVHFEVGGLFREFKVWNPTNGNHYSASGGGAFANLGFEVFKGFRILTNNFWSDGGGRYIFGQAPDLIAQADGSPSLIHAHSTVSGIEYTHKNSQVYAYYGGVYVQKNTAIDANGKYVGYGFPGSPAGQNRSIQEPTFGFAQTFWKDPKYGALTLMGQYSYVVRNPWSVANGQPEDAHLHMVFFNLRYALPGSAPAMTTK